MTPEYVISQLLESDSKHAKNLDLLKKIIVTAQLGRLQINGLPPDDKVSLANYLFDNENIMFDFSRIDEGKRELFSQWLLGAHQKNKTKARFLGITTNEYRGFTAETFLSWWGRIKSFFKGKYAEYWKLADISLSLDYQLVGVDVHTGKNGMLIGFDQLLSPSTATKYRDPKDSQSEPLGNTKRILITDQLVDQLIQLDIKKVAFEKICIKSHPQSISVDNMKLRWRKMHDYRGMQRFLAIEPWYIRFWNWLFPSHKKSTIGKVPPIKEILSALDSVLIKLTPELVKDTTDKVFFDLAKSTFSIEAPFACLKHFAKIKGQTHVMVHIFITLLTEFEKNQRLLLDDAVKANPEKYKKVLHSFKSTLDELNYLLNILNSNNNLSQDKYYAQWNLSYTQCIRVLRSIDNNVSTIYKSDADSIQIKKLQNTGEILVIEKRPEIDNIVFCGGGAKIFGHVGLWKALNEAQIRPTRFAGSSAGAIMALLCYLGHSADEITEFFKNFKQEHLIHFDINIKGMSEARSLKTAIDFAIANKLRQIVTQYDIPYPEGKITFETLESIRRQCPDCGIGKELIITATNVSQGKTRYFSLQNTPSFEVSESVKISGSFPIVYRSTLIDGEAHSDGGILTNFPTEAFFDDQTTLLESEYGNNLKVLAVQFDNGTERTAIDRIKDRVYKENFFMNWIYRLITGVNDPASGWEQDRMKLRKHSSQSIVINVDNISSSSFSISDSRRNKMIRSGYKATKAYLQTRYKRSDDDSHENQELMYTKFCSFADLLSYCCYRGNRHWFEKIGALIAESNEPKKLELMAQVEELRELYFRDNEPPKTKKVRDDNPPTFFGNAILQESISTAEKEYYKILLAVYPIFIKISPELLKEVPDKKFFDIAKHSLSIDAPFACLKHFAKIKGQVHIVVHIFINLFKELEKNLSLLQDEEIRTNPEEVKRVLNAFKSTLDGLGHVLNILNANNNLTQDKYYAKWDLSYTQSARVLSIMDSEQYKQVFPLLKSLRKREEPLQDVVAGEFVEAFELNEAESPEARGLNI